MIENRIKSVVLAEMLKHVPFEGWTTTVMHHAAEATAVSPVSLSLLFPRGVIDVINFFMAEEDLQMSEKIAALPLQSMKIRERITTAIKIRLEQSLVHKNAVRRAMSYYAMPHHTPDATQGLWHTASSIWYAIGDNSTDSSYYTKRLTLSTVYSSTLLFWLDDHSENYTETWDFLDRRIHNVMQLGKITTTIRGYLGKK